MSLEPPARFHEEQSLRQHRTLILVAIPPALLLLLLIWQVALGHSVGKRPMSNGSLIGWAIFLWIIYLRLIFVRMVTEVRPGELRVSMRGLWLKRRVALKGIKSIELITVNPVLDYGGYGFRATRRAIAYLARGNSAVRLEVTTGVPVIIGSQKAPELAAAIEQCKAPA